MIIHTGTAAVYWQLPVGDLQYKRQVGEEHRQRDDGAMNDDNGTRGNKMPPQFTVIKGGSSGRESDKTVLYEWVASGDVDRRRVRHLDISSYDFSGQTDLWSEFRDFHSHVAIDLSTLDVTNAQGLGCLLQGCESLTELDLSCLDTAQARNMACLLKNCWSLRSANLLGLSTAQVTDMRQMFFRVRVARSARPLALGYLKAATHGLYVPWVFRA